MFMDSNTSNSNNPTVVSISGCILTPEEEQSKWLAESLEVVHRAAGNLAYYVSQEDFSGSITGGVKEDATQHADPMAADENTMKLQKNAGENRTMQNFYLILKATTEMLDELRTSLLAPQTYYELYVVVFDKIQVFITYCDDLIRHKCITPEMLYETVQFTGALLSRLYLLVCAGSVYLSTMDNKLMASSVAKGKEGEEGAPEGRCAQLDIFVDLLEMSKGVQHPTRGLFLRHFLLTMMKGKLPGDFGFEAEGNVDAADIVYYTAHMLTTNLREMNWLWIRMESNRYSRPTSLSTAAENENNGSGAYGSPVSSSAPVKDKKGTLLTNESVTSSSTKIKETNKKNTLSDRNELKVLVGMNIVRISQLDGVTREMYKEKILPNLIPIVTKYREPLAQQYLVEILIQVFPDDFHLDTLETLLKIIFNLSPNVHVVPLVRFLLERLERFIVEYYEEKVNVVKDPSRQKDQNETEYRIEDKLFKNVFATIMNCLSTCEVSYEKVQPMEKLIRKTNNIPPPTPVLIVRYLEILTDVARFSLSVDLAAEKWVAATGSKDEEEGKTSKAVKHISSLLRYATERIQEGPELTPEMLLGAERLVTTVLSVPSVTENISTLLEIDAIPALVAKLPFISRRQVAVTLCETAQRYPEKHIETLEHAARLFELMDPLLTVQQDAPEDLTVLYKYNVKDEFIDEQNLVCRTLHLLESKKDPLLFIKMLTGARRLLGAGGPTRIPWTLPTLASLYLQAAIDVKEELDSAKDPEETEDNEKSPEEERGKKSKKKKNKDSDGAVDVAGLQKGMQKCFNYLFSGDGKGVLEVLSTEKPFLAYQLYLTSAQVADRCELNDVAYALFTEVLALYEREVPDNEQQIEMLYTLVNALYKLKNCSEENYETLAARVCQRSSKLVTKQDQSIMIARCGALFMKKGLPEETQARLVECVERAIKLAGQVQGVVQLELYVELLNTFLLYFKMNFIEADCINSVLDQIREISEKERASQSNPTKPNEDGEAADTTSSGAYDRVRVSYRNTTKYIRSRQTVDARWEDIEV